MSEQKNASVGRRVAAKAVGAVFWCEVALVVLLAIAVFGGIPFGITNYVVQSGSMTPTIPVGSIVYVDTNVEPDQVEPGDVIAFDLGQGKVCTHRAIAVDKSVGLIETQGDANANPDAAKVSYDSLIGREVAHVPEAGFALAWMTDNRLLFALAVGGVLVATYAASRLLEGKQG